MLTSTSYKDDATGVKVYINVGIVGSWSTKGAYYKLTLGLNGGWVLVPDWGEVRGKSQQGK